MQLSDAEWKVMKVVWTRSPASAREVLEAIEPETGWAYTTVKTIMARLVEKGALTAKMRANTNLYSPKVTEQQARRSAVRSLIDKAFDGAFGPLLQYLVGQEKLSTKDRKALIEMLEEGRSKGAREEGHAR